MADQCWDVKLLEVKGKVTPSGEASKHPASNRSSNSMRSHTQRHDPVTSAIRDRGREPSGNIATEYRRLLLGQMPTLQNIKPASITPRGWLTFRPAGPKTAPGVELVA